MMKTKSYEIHTKSKTSVLVSETQGQDAVIVKIIGPASFIKLNKQEWHELTQLQYELTCNEPVEELSQVPDLTVEADTDITVELPTADKTIAKLRGDIEDD
jgi:hypothetical protein